ncbi:MAG: aminodeoxychorismate synthase component I, partial [Propionibacteriales bacterium]|nr:aminodeoxychorismate synthase component I [Propionibacteriales bacterium]
RIHRSDDDPCFAGGWIGAWGYQLGSRIESLPPAPDRPLPMADFHLSFYDWVVLLREGSWWFEALVTAERRAVLEAAYERVAGRMAAAATLSRDCVIDVFEMDPTAEQHKLALAKTLDHIAAGDIFQANICVRLEAGYVGDPLDAFCQGVEQLRPAYAAFLRTDDGAIASMSPELFLRRDGDALLTSPIKGTAPLGTDVDELVESAKDRAENIMIVDLMRNDLGRVSVPGSIEVTAMARVESHAVWHLVSDVVGTLRHGVTDAELLRATFPPGSVTGAPKVRAMEIINQLEATGRETYTGAIGYVSPCAGIELNVVIRTFEFKGNRVWLGVGGGIVSDSTPEQELAECLVKATPLIRAVGASLDPGLAAAVVVQPEWEPRVHSIERQRHNADPQRGVFETLLVRDGEIIERAGHLARFASSLRELYGVDVPT